MNRPESTSFLPTARRPDDWHATVVELSGDGAYQIDRQGRFTTVNDVVLDATGYDAEQLLGEHFSLVLDDSSVGRAEQVHRELLDEEARTVTETATVRTADGETFSCEFRMAPLVEDGEVRGTVGVARDLTGRQLREHRLRDERDELRARFEQVRSRVTDAVYALDEDWRFTYLNERAEEVMDVEAGAVLGESIWSVFPEATDSELWDRYHEAMDRQQSVSFETFYEPTEVWFEASVYPSETGLSVYFRDVTERKTHEQELTAQRERLATLNDLNRVVQDVTHAIVAADTREEVERAVPEHLAAAPSIAGAWFGTAESGGERIHVTSEAGATPEEPVRIVREETLTPVGKAYRSGESQTVADLGESEAGADLGDSETAVDLQAVPAADRWPVPEEDGDYRSAAAIPVSFQGVRYGVLVVYGTDAGTFEGDAGRVVCALGGVVGHALNALDRKRALAGDEVTELELRIEDVFETRDVDAEAECGRAVFESILPVGDGRYVAYGSACEDGIELLDAMQEGLAHYRELDFRERRADDDRFVLQMYEPPLTTLTTSPGGRIEEATIQDGALLATVSLPSDVDVRAFVERVSEAYPGVEVLAQRRVRRPGVRVDTFQAVLDEELTERQRVALEAAYVAGFFEWPRETNGKELAASLDVTPATFHQHLREAERRVITALFGASGEETR